MPVIKGYDAPDTPLHTTNVGVDATAAAARRVGTYYDAAASAIKEVGREAGQVVKGATDLAYNYMESRELSKGAADLATLHEGITKQWNDRAKNADPNDPTVAAKFREDVLEPALEGFSKRFTTSGAQKWAESRVNAFREHIVTKASGDMATLAGNAAVINTHQTINSLSNTVRDDPSAIDETMKVWESAFEATIKANPNLTGVQVSNLRRTLLETGRGEIAKSAMVGLAQNDPARAIALAEDPNNPLAKYLTGSDIKAIVANAKQQQRAARIDERYAEQLRKMEEKQASEKNESEFIRKMYSQDPAEQAQVTAQAIVNMKPEQLDNSSKRVLLSMLERREKPEPAAAISRDESRKLFERITADPDAKDKITDIRDIQKAFIEEKLVKADYDWLVRQFNESRTPEGQRLDHDRTEFFKRYSASIDGAMDMTGHSALGSQRIYQAQVAARRLEAELRKKGVDPHEVYDPSSQHFFGRPDNLSRYRVSLTDALNYRNVKTETPTKPQAPANTPPPKFERADKLPEGAVQGNDGFYYFERDGKWFRLRPVQ